MASKVTINYTGLPAAETQTVAPISPLFVPTTSYADSTPYEGTVYDTNVYGIANAPLPHPFDTLSIPSGLPLWQIHLEGVDVSEGKIEFTVQTDYEKLYWEEMARELADQGVVIKVEDAGE